MSRTYHIGNMKCMGCVSTVQKALQELPGCERTSVDLDSATASVSGDLDTDRLMKTLAELGYPATPID